MKEAVVSGAFSSSAFPSVDSTFRLPLPHQTFNAFAGKLALRDAP
jgi:hypothetical protein